jgi:hypothetical protein
MSYQISRQIFDWNAFREQVQNTITMPTCSITVIFFIPSAHVPLFTSSRIKEELIQRLCKHWQRPHTVLCVYGTTELSITNCEVSAADDLFRRLTPDLVASPSMKWSLWDDGYKWLQAASRFPLSACTKHPCDPRGERQFYNGGHLRLDFLSTLQG